MNFAINMLWNVWFLELFHVFWVNRNYSIKRVSAFL